MPHSPAEVRALAERLVAISSVSPDVAGENRAADALVAALPEGIERGAWPLADERRVVWARVRGRDSRRALLVLGHHDTVGVEEYAALGSAALAFQPRDLRERLLESPAGVLAPALAADLDEERRAPGAWMFGRGALDMKSGLAAGIAALASVATAPPPHDVLLVSTPDEEHESAGMLAVAPRLAELAAREQLSFIGALNLDYSTAPVAYAGVVGKALLGMYVRGVPAHVGDPFAGLDAIQMAAAIVRRLSTSGALREGWEGEAFPPPVPLRLRDLKPAYNVQTAAETVVEWNVILAARPLDAVIAAIARETRAALEVLSTELRELSGASAAWHAEVPVRSLSELAPVPGEGPLAHEDARAHALRVVRERVAAAGLPGAVVVLHLLPPFYPAAAPGSSRWLRAARGTLEREGVPVRPLYPFISDASYLRWREPEAPLAANLSSWDGDYRLPLAAMNALDLDVLNLGPWGRDAHGVGERVNAGWAFVRLPGLIERLMRTSA